MLVNNHLRGRIEKVHIDDILTGRCAVGRLGSKQVYVDNGVDYIGRECIVKMGLWPRQPGRCVKGSFVTSHVPEGFSGLGYDRYVLVGVWEPWMEKRSNVPYLEEIKKYYDPGDMGEVYFFRDNKSNKRGGLAVVDEMGRIGVHETVSALVMDYLTDYDVFSRVVVAEPLKVVNVMMRICEFGLIPVLMEPLNSK